MIKNVERLNATQLLQLRESYRSDIRSLDDMNFTIISALGTITLGIITVGTALRNPDFIAFFFAGIVIVNCLAVEMLLRNRISVLEKTWYVCYFESKLPLEYRHYSPFGFAHFNEPWPKGTAYSFMINVHKILIIVGFAWAFASLQLFQEHSQHLVENFLTSLPLVITGLPNIGPYIDFLFWLGANLLFGILAAYVWKYRITRGYEKRWENSIWKKKSHLLEAIKKQFEELKVENDDSD